MQTLSQSQSTMQSPPSKALSHSQSAPDLMEHRLPRPIRKSAPPTPASSSTSPANSCVLWLRSSEAAKDVFDAYGAALPEGYNSFRPKPPPRRAAAAPPLSSLAGASKSSPPSDSPSRPISSPLRGKMRTADEPASPTIRKGKYSPPPPPATPALPSLRRPPTSPASRTSVALHAPLPTAPKPRHSLKPTHRHFEVPGFFEYIDAKGHRQFSQELATTTRFIARAKPTPWRPWREQPRPAAPEVPAQSVPIEPLHYHTVSPHIEPPMPPRPAAIAVIPEPNVTNNGEMPLTVRPSVDSALALEGMLKDARRTLDPTNTTAIRVLQVRALSSRRLLPESMVASHTPLTRACALSSGRAGRIGAHRRGGQMLPPRV